MRNVVTLSTRARRCLALGVVMALTVVASATSLWAEGESASIVKVEEQWELVVAEVESDRSAPQVTVVFSPQGDLNGLYAAFELNHQSQPVYAGGGVQLQVWNANEVPAATRRQKDGQNLVHASETITWTQKMELANGQITFDIDDGVSTSWGAFGDGIIASVSTSLANLNAYNPLVSVNGSGVGFASNRVTSLKLKSVKVQLSTGEVVEDNTVKVAYPKQ